MIVNKNADAHTAPYSHQLHNIVEQNSLFYFSTFF